MGIWKAGGARIALELEGWVAKLRDLATDESADLLAAIARRVLRIGVFAVLVGAFAILTPFGTLWQTFEIRKQVEKQAEQNALQAEQNALLAADIRIVRRAQLLATVYEEECRESPAAEDVTPWSVAVSSVETEGELFDPVRICTARFHIRARQEAVLAFVEIERSHGDIPDFRGAKLRGADLRHADLELAQLQSVASRVGADDA